MKKSFQNQCLVIDICYSAAAITLKHDEATNFHINFSTIYELCRMNLGFYLCFATPSENSLLLLLLLLLGTLIPFCRDLHARRNVYRWTLFVTF